MEYSVVVVTRNRRGCPEAEPSAPRRGNRGRRSRSSSSNSTDDTRADPRPCVDEVGHGRRRSRFDTSTAAPGHDGAAQHRPGAGEEAGHTVPRRQLAALPRRHAAGSCKSTSATSRALSAASAAPRSPGRRRTWPVGSPRRATPAKPGPARPGSRSVAAGKLKARLVADPFAKLADHKYARLRAPAWLAGGGGQR